MPKIRFYHNIDTEMTKNSFEEAFSSTDTTFEMSRVPMFKENIRVKEIEFEVVRVTHVLDDDYDAAVEVKLYL
ncbi:hypothetical protein [Vreelandella titanicae]|uniref:hypothetical protein n=1 Tax=Vreelandella titanicae TaxID=664683 RepID=UPI00114486B8|nr:hypothetical protein [Halomonas titanicae]